MNLVLLIDLVPLVEIGDLYNLVSPLDIGAGFLESYWTFADVAGSPDMTDQVGNNDLTPG